MRDFQKFKMALKIDEEWIRERVHLKHDNLGNPLKFAVCFGNDWHILLRFPYCCFSYHIFVINCTLMSLLDHETRCANVNLSLLFNTI